MVMMMQSRSTMPHLPSESLASRCPEENHRAARRPSTPTTTTTTTPTTTTTTSSSSPHHHHHGLQPQQQPPVFLKGFCFRMNPLLRKWGYSPKVLLAADQLQDFYEKVIECGFPVRVSLAHHYYQDKMPEIGLRLMIGDFQQLMCRYHRSGFSDGEKARIQAWERTQQPGGEGGVTTTTIYTLLRTLRPVWKALEEEMAAVIKELESEDPIPILTEEEEAEAKKRFAWHWRYGWEAREEEQKQKEREQKEQKEQEQKEQKQKEEAEEPNTTTHHMIQLQHMMSRHALEEKEEEEAQAEEEEGETTTTTTTTKKRRRLVRGGSLGRTTTTHDDDDDDEMEGWRRLPPPPPPTTASPSPSVQWASAKAMRATRVSTTRRTVWN
jgi:hypothetical protein